MQVEKRMKIRDLTSFASNLTYRAWGGRKSMTYGNTTSEQTTYNSRASWLSETGRPSTLPISFLMNSAHFVLGLFTMLVTLCFRSVGSG